ncbi:MULTISPECIES: MgtC/SapB family protein [unclassified Chelatococcus]|uniref:MgtC/SapB family protein n=1 Tax=unclassified Chelatococcus TaxID=2638111 RepID=UPI001BCE00A8|nr:MULTISPECIES: MgtC/SapB family protein [unclassified Chelatococcus]CAH1672484.1 Protein MgtC [Hyphomicrobiales bacterium]MBS7738595.1 MgtC/SapB family protein [Chelatococcus sp. HY11]MBX3542999.1 MgtC/SapB family protein [Chelatococcus sp.]MCO5076875.1 MgtC/SapB family protein [Chelatococcus sp.]CAH1675272.1 Protein MgtC [Hyphomicrobiales bacterium]
MHPDIIDQFLRLGAATLIGMIIGLNRDLENKPTGMRTLGLVGLATALVTIGTLEFEPLSDQPDALSRVVQGLIQGVLTGIGFIGAGAILHDRATGSVQGLTTAASVWVTAAAGIVCGLGNWHLVVTAVTVAMVLLLSGRPIEAAVERVLGRISPRRAGRHDFVGPPAAGNNGNADRKEE